MEWIDAQPTRAELDDRDVHIWRFPLSISDGADASEVLSDEERARAEAMASPKAKRSFIASQRALRHIISGYTGVAPRQIEVARGPHGKPALSAPAGALEFNVSHSGEWGVIAIAATPVGVDVEQVREGRTSERVQTRFLTEGERALLALRAESHGDAAFFIVWSRKEAYLKATGLGLAAPFSRVDSSEDRLPDLDAYGEVVHGGAPWSVREFLVDAQHPAAIVARVDEPSLRYHTLPGKKS